MTPIRTSEPDKWADTERHDDYEAWEAADTGMAPMEERLRRSKANVAMLDALPERQWLTPPSEAEVEASMRRLVAPLLTDSELALVSKGHRTFERLERRHSGRAG